jgi:alkaline phosphatase D
MPVREGEHGILHRAFHIGDLASLFLLDTRIEGRDRQARWHLDYAVLDDPSRQLLGLAQEAWVVDGIASAQSAYKIIASQVMLAPLRRPQASPTERPSPLRTDTWDGYPEARARLLRAIESRNVRDLLVLSGDIHSSWASELAREPYDPTHYDPVTGRGAIGVEFVTPSITSPSVVAREALAGLLSTNRHVQWAELTRSGYMLLELSERGATASYTLFDDVTVPETRAETAATFRVARGASHIEAVRTAV